MTRKKLIIFTLCAAAVFGGFLIAKAGPGFSGGATFPGDGIWNSSGKIGIGTTSPSYPLTLNSGSETGILTIDNGTSVYLSHGGWSMGAGRLGIGNGSNPTLIVSANANGGTAVGNVGIGVTNPTSKLSVSGDASILGGTTNSTNDATLYISATNDNDWGLVVDKYSGGSTNYGEDIRVANTSPYALRITGSGSEVFRVLGNGNVTLNGKTAFKGGDSWLRINEDSGFTSGIYTGGGVLRTDGEFQVGGSGATFKVTNGGNVTVANGLTLGGVTRTTWPVSSSDNPSPIFIETIYGDGDLPWRSYATSPQTMRTVYGPFAYYMPSCATGYTKYYRLYAEFVDNITNTGQTVYTRIAFADGQNLDFNFDHTWGGSPSYRTYLSSLFQTSNSNHANIQAWINGASGPYLEIRKLQIWAYCL